MSQNGIKRFKMQEIKMRDGWMDLLTDQQSLRPGWIAQRGEWTDKRTNGQTGQNISPLYRASSPIGAAALLTLMKTKKSRAGQEPLTSRCLWATYFGQRP